MLLVVENVRLDVPEPPADRATADGFKDIVGPEGDTVALRDTLPDRPLTLDRVMLEFAEVPGGAESVLGLADRVKSTTRTTT